MKGLRILISFAIALSFLAALSIFFGDQQVRAANAGGAPPPNAPALEPLPEALPPNCTEGTQASGALYRICRPIIPGAHDDLVLYAHGFVEPDAPLAIPTEAEAIATYVNLQGYAFATTSYRMNGLAIRPGMEDLQELIDIYTGKYGTPYRVILMGFSEGGIITALSVEEYPEIYAGGLAMCGPYGDFQEQVNYFAGFRAVFDYYFPNLLPGSAISVPQSLIDNWETTFDTQILPVISNPANAVSVTNLLAVTGAPTDADQITQTIHNALWYQVHTTTDGISKLGGQPFDNSEKVYSGSSDDAALNAGVIRYTADLTPTQTIANLYETDGLLERPIVLMHTNRDEIVPYWHQTLYKQKSTNGENPNLMYTYTINRYGHCNFTQNEIITAFGKLIQMIDNPPAPPPAATIYLPLVTR
ncbi:MAG: hypothetical protein OHK0052_05910 [Anaerolineales bacterium]